VRKPANSSDMVRFSGKSFRLGEKIRLDESAHDTTLDPKGTSRKACLKSAKNLYLRHRFFDKIRQIHRFFDIFRQKLQILCRNQARTSVRPTPVVHLARNPSTSSICAQETRYPHEVDTGLKSTYDLYSRPPVLALAQPSASS